MKILAFSPRLTPERARSIGAEAATLERLLAESDFVVIAAPLTEETRGMIGAAEIARMRRQAVLVNVAAGPSSTRRRWPRHSPRRGSPQRASSLDPQPFAADDPLAALDNVVLSPHMICDTYELRRDVLTLIARELAVFAGGRAPANMLNPAVLQRESFLAKWQAITRRG